MNIIIKTVYWYFFCNYTDFSKQFTLNSKILPIISTNIFFKQFIHIYISILPSIHNNLIISYTKPAQF